MKIHAPTFLPPPAPPAPPPARNDPSLASTKAPMAFDQALGAKPGTGEPAQAGTKGRGDHSGAASRRLPAPPPTSPPPAAPASAEAPVETRAADPYAPGSIVDIEA
jgi:hypothetical protein